MSSFRVTGSPIDFEALEAGFSEERLSAAVRALSVAVVLPSASDWEDLSAQVTKLDTERVPDGEFVIDELGGAGEGELYLDDLGRGPFTAYLTAAKLTYFTAATGEHLASLEFLATGDL